MAEAYGEDWDAMDGEERMEMASKLLEHDEAMRESLSEVEGSEPLLMAAYKTLRGLEEREGNSEVGAAYWACLQAGTWLLESALGPQTEVLPIEKLVLQCVGLWTAGCMRPSCNTCCTGCPAGWAARGKSGAACGGCWRRPR